MLRWLITLIAFVSTGTCILLWFRDVHRIMLERKYIVESAGRQLIVCQEKAMKTQNTSEARAVLARSEDIYRQALDLYNRSLQKPWNYLPAYLMGFRRIS